MLEIKILETSRDLTKREKVKIKDLGGQVSIMDEIKNTGQPVLITPTGWAKLAVHNPHAKEGRETDYNKLVIFDEESGELFNTGSATASDSFVDIFSDMTEGSAEFEKFDVKFYTKKSNNYNGDFLACSLV